eukprot:8628951-Lingulodinium_polyedra.AAC.1
MSAPRASTPCGDDVWRVAIVHFAALQPWTALLVARLSSFCASVEQQIFRTRSPSLQRRTT